MKPIVRTFWWMSFILLLSACGSAPTNDGENLESDQRAKAAEARLAAATGYLGNGQLDRAKAHLDKAVEHQPNNADVQATLGYYYSLVGEMALAAHQRIDAVGNPLIGAELCVLAVIHRSAASRRDQDAGEGARQQGVPAATTACDGAQCGQRFHVASNTR